MVPGTSPGAGRSARKLRALAGGVALVVALLLAYWPALRGGLLWDDAGHLTRPELQSWRGLGRIWTELGATQQYYPLLHSAFWVEHRLWGDTVLGYHLTNLLLHALSGGLVVFIVEALFTQETGLAAQRRTLSPGVAWLAGFLFALHPVCVESVAWISEQKNALSGVFYLSAALAYLQFDRNRRRSTYVGATGLFILALLSKSVTATLPAALLVVLWWRRGRLGWRRDVAPLLPWLAIGAGWGLFSAWVERTYVGAAGAGFDLTLVQRSVLAGRVVWFYLAKLVWPTGLSFIYPRWTIDPTAAGQYAGLVGALVLAAGLAWLARRWRGPFAGLLFFVGTLFPVLGFLNVYPFLFSYVADHFQYLASLGVIVPAAVGLGAAAGRLPPGLRLLRPVLGGILVAGLGALTWRQSGEYRDATTLYRATLVRNPGCWLAHNNLGNILALDPARQAEAAAEFQAALALKPDLAEAHFNLANALARLPGRLGEALAEYRAALRLQPDYPEAHNNFGRALARTPGGLPAAIAQITEALRLAPSFAEAHNNLGVALSLTPGRLADAMREYRAALRLKPDFAEARFNLANALARLPGRESESIAEYESALRLERKFAAAHCNLGLVLMKLPGRQAEARAEFEAALRLQPSLEAARRMVNVLDAVSPSP